ncbi:MAG: hypothetical protein ACI93T_001517 [Porticoccaceae bacterium]|jgi:hypothetical protein
MCDQGHCIVNRTGSRTSLRGWMPLTWLVLSDCRRALVFGSLVDEFQCHPGITTNPTRFAFIGSR